MNLKKEKPEEFRDRRCSPPKRKKCQDPRVEEAFKILKKANGQFVKRDGGYPQDAHLHTPYSTVSSGSPTEEYNVVHSRERYVIERFKKQNGKNKCSRKKKSRAHQNEAKKLEEKLKSKNGMKALRLNRRGVKKIQTKEAEASKIRTRKMREKRKLESSTSQLPSTSAIPYSSPQMLGKVVREIKKVLPSSLRGKKTVVEKIASDLGLS
ncbi:hypothetical protein AVEN_256230-1 [Araneus ventricosus]|uniref:Uncharacterized protein n=1 Tax=Araneus ventricosus TaxID=182803 RepID=A0A4Y2LT92_ARAVE|nr:hypothetical protein AVEN_256230-1 [Araneus ventricosus]